MLYTHGFVYILLHLDIVHWIYIRGACILKQFHVHIQRMAARQKNISNLFPLQLPDLTVNQVNIAAYRLLGTIIALHPRWTININNQHSLHPNRSARINKTQRSKRTTNSQSRIKNNYSKIFKQVSISNIYFPWRHFPFRSSPSVCSPRVLLFFSCFFCSFLPDF